MYRQVYLDQLALTNGLQYVVSLEHIITFNKANVTCYLVY